MNGPSNPMKVISSGLAEALAKVQAELPTVSKNKTAKVKGTTRQGDRYEYEYKYADYADVAAKIMPLLGKNGLSFSAQPTLRDDGKFGLAYQLLHSSGELLEGFYPIDASVPIQQVGSAITYARRYSLSAITGIAAEEDTDGQGGQYEHGKPPEDRSAMGQALARNEETGSPYEGGQAGTTDTHPAIQELALLAWAIMEDPAGTVERLQAEAYEPARTHRGWLSAWVGHPKTGEKVPLSAVIREAKAELEKRL